MGVIVSGLHYYALAMVFAAFILRSLWFKRAGEWTQARAGQQLKNIHVLLHAGLFLALLTGLYRLFGPLDKGAAYYMKNGLFHGKLGLVFLIITLELVCLFKAKSWLHEHYKSGQNFQAKGFKVLHMISAHLFALIPFLAAAVARAIG